MTLALLLLSGITLLLLGGHYLVRHAVELAAKLNVPPLVIGLTIVAFGTSAPELVISVDAVLTGHDDIVIGNIIGSNIANLLLVLAVSALIFAVRVVRRTVGREGAILTGATVLFGWLCWNGNCRGHRLLRLSNGNLAVNVGPGVQGHTGQFLSMLAQSYVPSEFEIRIQGKSFTVDDLIAYEQATCRPRTELTFKLIGLSHYLPSDAEWVRNDGQKWSIARLIEEEIAQPVVGAACGGTHRLMGLTYAVKNRVDEGKPLDGEWKRAERFIEDFQKYTIGLQNPDGSFSTKWFERREARTDSQRRVQTTGHILEWLTCNLPEEHLTSPEIVKAAAYLSNLMYRERGTDWKIGPKGHAIHALNLYDQKVFNARVGMGGPRMDWNSVESLQR